MSFLSDIQRFADSTGNTLDETVRSLRLEAVKSVVSKTPVKTGQAKGSMIAAIGSPADSPTDVFDLTGGTAAAVARAQGAINAPSNNIFYYTSNLPYIKYLENGSSSQHPNGMFKVTAIILREHIRNTINASS